MKKTDINKTNDQQIVKSYSPIKLTVYGKVAILTAAGTGSTQEPTGTSKPGNKYP